jgi:hypothetical protein
VRAQYTAPELLPLAAVSAPSALAVEPAGHPAAGVRAEIFHPPSL